MASFKSYSNSKKRYLNKQNEIETKIQKIFNSYLPSSINNLIHIEHILKVFAFFGFQSNYRQTLSHIFMFMIKQNFTWISIFLTQDKVEHHGPFGKLEKVNHVHWDCPQIRYCYYKFIILF